jgi:tetratricopeptide (TPR) repeat protein
MGGRLSQIRVIAPFSMEISQFLKDVGLCEDESVFNENRDNLSFSIEASRFMKYCQNKVLSSSSFTLCNILGRMSHEARKFDDAIKFYTLALQLKPTSPKIFCHLGSVYHERGDLKLAFASYQQVIELNPKGMY